MFLNCLRITKEALFAEKINYGLERVFSHFRNCNILYTVNQNSVVLVTPFLSGFRFSRKFDISRLLNHYTCILFLHVEIQFEYTKLDLNKFITPINILVLC